MVTQERGDTAVVTCPGKRRGSGSHSQWVITQERGEVAAVICSGWVQRERRGRRSKAWLLMGERRLLYSLRFCSRSPHNARHSTSVV